MISRAACTNEGLPVDPYLARRSVERCGRLFLLALVLVSAGAGCGSKKTECADPFQSGCDDCRTYEQRQREIEGLSADEGSAGSYGPCEGHFFVELTTDETTTTDYFDADGKNSGRSTVDSDGEECSVGAIPKCEKVVEYTSADHQGPGGAEAGPE